MRINRASKTRRARKTPKIGDVEISRWTPTTGNIGWLVAVLVLVILPHLSHLPIWVPIAAAMAGGWRLLELSHRVPVLPAWLRASLTGAAVLGIFASYHTVVGRDAGVAMLTILCALKILETRALRDAYVVCSLFLFLIGSSFLYSQSLALGAYLIIAIIGALSALVTVGDFAGELNPRRRVKLAATVLLQSVPLLAVLFVLFPRIPGPLWGLPNDAHAGVSKLGDSMTPGNISELSLSDEVAFRVKFEGEAPPTSELYWRGPVLWNTNGRKWTRERTQVFNKVELGARRATPYDYTVTLEPHRERWLFALDMPVHLPRGAQIGADYQLLHPTRLRERHQYQLRSYTDYEARHIDPYLKELALKLPVGFHPRARQMAQRWSKNATNPQTVVDRALRYFRTQPFYYTLRPPRLEGDTVDEFLFISRRGFCEHYAAAFTILMRAAGIPARVVTGYQGGEPNALGGYLIVRNRDAHAWAEVWMDDRGWVRVDPTAAVSPDRIERGVDSAIPPTVGPRFLGLRPSGAVDSMWRAMRHGWDTVNNRWNQWIIDYGSGKQSRLLERFGLNANHWSTLVFIMVGAIMVLLLALALWLIRRPRAADPILRAYDRFCRKLARQGFTRRPDEGPLDYGKRVAGARPEWRHDVMAIVRLYVQLRYTPNHTSNDVREMISAVREFRPA
ncbi:MAG: DUF3488 and transglutaminase-like domain-containing protein [Pseudomonadota bacterium]